MKRWIFLFLCCALLLLCAACNPKPPEDNSSAQNETTTASEDNWTFPSYGPEKIVLRSPLENGRYEEHSFWFNQQQKFRMLTVTIHCASEAEAISEFETTRYRQNLRRIGTLLYYESDDLSYQGATKAEALDALEASIAIEGLTYYGYEIIVE